MHDLINRTSQNVTLDDRTHILIFASFSRGDIPPRPISPSLYNHSLLVKFKVLRLPYYRSILGPLNLLGQGPIYIWPCVPIVNMLYVSFILLVLLKKKKKGLFFFFPLLTNLLSLFVQHFSVLFSINLLWVVFITYKLFYIVLHTPKNNWNHDLKSRFPLILTSSHNFNCFLGFV